MSSDFGKNLKVSIFGQSHSAAIGAVIDGLPAGYAIDEEALQAFVDRRRAKDVLSTARREADKVNIVSGLFEGKTCGAPLALFLENNDVRSSDYDELRVRPRPSHADYTYQMKYGIRDPRGGGRSSARETISRCVAGAIARQILAKQGIDIKAYTSQVGNICLDKPWEAYDLNRIEENPVRCPDPDKAIEMEELIAKVKSQGDTIGGIISGVITGVPVGLGEPVFGKLHAALGNAMLSINAVKGFEYGDGFAAAGYRGSERNDCFFNDNGKINVRTNHSGGIQGGISNGQPIYFRVAFKSVATLLREQETVDMEGNDTILKARGRHDPCVLPRAVPIVEAMAAMTLLDYWLMQQTRVMER